MRFFRIRIIVPATQDLFPSKRDECSGDLQMEELAVQAVGSLLPIVGKVAKNAFGTFLHDTPPVKTDEPGDYSIVNLPKQVSSLALMTEDTHPDQSALVSTTTGDNFRTTSVLERCKVLSRLAIVSWPETTVAGATLFTCPVTPTICASFGVTGFVYQEHTALSYFSTLYQFWRGGLRFTVECLPTRFHQGQLYVSFNPNLAPFTLTGARNCTSATIDLGMTNRTTLDIPYVAQTDYLDVLLVPGLSTPVSLLDTLGTFSVFVQNPLNSNGTVATNIDLNIYIQALDDFEYKVPRLLNPGVEMYHNGVWQGREEVRGELQMNEEVNVKQLLSPPLQQPQQEHSGTEATNVAISANVVTADTANILEREYMLSFGIPFATSDGLNAQLYSAAMPDTFWSTDLATRGLFDYHEFYRMDFKMTIRINPTSFHQGALLFYWNPLSLDTTWTSINTFTQFPHAILNVAAETTASFVIPYAAMTRFLRGPTPTMGAVRVLVWNTLKAPSTAPQTLNFSIWAQALNPHIAVKRQAGTQVPLETTGVLEMAEMSDTGRGVATSQVAYKQSEAPQTGFVKSDHMNVLTLLRRPAFINSAAIPRTTDVIINAHQYSMMWEFPCFASREHCYVLGTYLGSAGSNRIVAASSAGRATNITGIATPLYTDNNPPRPTPAPLAPAGRTLAGVYNGGKQWQLAGEQEKVIEVPYYRRYPMTNVWNATANYRTGWPTIRIGYIAWDGNFEDATGPRIQSQLYHSVGDDFMVYYPIAMPNTRIAVPLATAQADSTAARIRVKRSGDVEENPGPDVDFQKWIDRVNVEGDFELWGWSNPITSVASGVTAQLSGPVNDAMASVKETSDVLRKSAEQLNVTLNSQGAAILKDAVGLGDSKLLELLKRWKSAAETILNLAINIYVILRGGAMRTAAMISIGLTLGGFLGTEFMNKLKNMVQPRVQGDGDLQGAGHYVPLLLGFGPAIVKAVLAMWEFEFGDDETKGLAYRMKERLGSVSGLSASVCAMVEVVVEYIFEGSGYARDWYRLSSAACIQFSKDVAVAHEKSTYTTLTLRDPVVRCQLDKLANIAKRIKAYGPQCDRFNVQYLKDAERVLDWTRLKTDHQTSARCPPVGVALAGGSATGKSFLASSALPAALLLKLGLAQTAEEATHQVWNKPTGAETHFYDGYCQQRITYIDDFLKDTDAPDAKDVINMISASQYAVDMAKIEDKGMFFKSEFIIVTTNTLNFGAVHGLSHADALCTRFANHAYTVRVRPQDGADITGSQAVQRYAAELKALATQGQVRVAQLIALVDKYWRFTKLEVKGGHARDDVTFDVLLEAIANEYRIKHSAYGELASAMKGIIQGDSSDSDTAEEDDSNLDWYGHPACTSYGNNPWTKEYAASSPRVSPEQHMRDMTRRRSESDIDRIVQEVRNSVRDGDFDGYYREIAQAELTALGVYPGEWFDVKDPLAWDRQHAHTVASNVLAACRPKPSRRWKGLLVVCGVVGALGLAAAAIISLVKFIVGGFVGVLQGALYDGSAKTHRAAKSVPSTGILEESNLRLERIRKNMRELQIYDEEEGHPVNRMHALALGSKNIVFPHHFWLSYQRMLTGGMKVHIRISRINPRGEFDGWVRIPLNALTVKHVEGPRPGDVIDLCVAYCHSANINGARKIMHLIPTRQEFQNMLAGKEMATYIVGTGEDLDINVRLGVREAVNFRPQGQHDTESVQSYAMLVSQGAASCTTFGDCGRPYVVLDPARRMPLAGLHSAKLTALAPNGNLLGATPLILEDIEKALSYIDIPKVAPIECTGEVQGDRVSNKFWNPSTYTEGKAEWNGTPLCVWTPTKTDKRRWLEHPEWADKFLPSCKTVVGERHALYTNAQKHEEKATAIVPVRTMRMCVEHYAAKFPKDRDQTVFTESEMINGKEPMQPLAMNTSCGFLGKVFKDGKKELFDADDSSGKRVWSWSQAAAERYVPFYETTFLERLADVESRMEKGEAPFMPWVATLKDELRPIEKVRACKTRVFEQPPFEFTLLMRKHFGAFANWIKGNPGFVTHSAIGIDKECKWREFYMGLKEKGPDGFDVDYSNYDGSVGTQAFDFFRMVTDKYYGNESVVRHSLLHILQNSWIVVGDQLMHTTQGNKSGNPLTDLFNSVTNVWVLYVCYLDTRVRHGLSNTLAQFDRDVAMLTYGDDVIITADPTVLPYFNRKSVAECAAQLGMTVTAANKGAELVAHEPLEELTFLKSRFVPEGAVVRAPMPEEVAIRELQFIDRHNVHDSRIQSDIMDNALRFRAHDGREAVEKLLSQLSDVGLSKAFDYNDFSFELYDKQVRDGYDHAFIM